MDFSAIKKNLERNLFAVSCFETVDEANDYLAEKIKGDFVASLILSFEDEVNRPENVRKLEEDFYKLLLFIENEHTFHRLCDTILDSLRNDNREKIGFVLHALRMELGVQEEGKALQHTEFWKEVGPKMTAFVEEAEKYRKSGDAYRSSTT